MDFLASPEFWLALGQIIIIDILLGGDNAVVIALACRKLPPAQRTKGIIWGTAGAIVLRVILIAFALTLAGQPLTGALAGQPVLHGYMSSPFGRRSDPLTGRLTVHKGVDFAAKAGSEVVAVAAGVDFAGSGWSGEITRPVR